MKLGAAPDHRARPKTLSDRRERYPLDEWRRPALSGYRNPPPTLAHEPTADPRSDVTRRVDLAAGATASAASGAQPGADDDQLEPIFPAAGRQEVAAHRDGRAI